MSIKEEIIVVVSALAFGAMASAPALAQGDEAPATTRVADPAVRVIQRFDGDGDGKVTLSEYLAGEKNRFAAADGNRDGYLTAEELEVAAEARVNRRADRLLKRLDSNRDGRVSWAEAEELGIERVRRRFVRLDADDDGFVTTGEIDSVSGAAADRIQARMIGRLDSDRDGRISSAEADTSRERRFARIDSDGDGAVTAAELRDNLRRRPIARDHDAGLDR